MKYLTLEEHRARIENTKSAALGNRTFVRRHRIGEYLPAQAVYHLGDYPAPFSIEPTEYDYNMIKGMAENGVQLESFDDVERTIPIHIVETIKD